VPKAPKQLEVTALDRALRLLTIKARTEAELGRALQRAGVPEAERSAAVARLRELGYMDDAAVAGARARTLLEQGASLRLAQRKLQAQGVASLTARAAAAEAAEGTSERELVERALQKRLRGRPPRDEKERNRIFRALVSKGHRASLVAQALRLRWDGADEVDDGGEEDAR
jgi:regulatory protein